ncbi:MAG TPA: macrolide ABC transporter ATP-binding protein [Candidatus Pacebacteria bacterium]|nr:MAG: ABC transporter related protein [Microgenomates group bacterium GW2011_GWF1_44_10]OGJ41259.1 MAG: macrolide ABC transporter ATP-binding protein [Candidatus Pacebacteria bacterium RIFOXYB1_FULL_44_10]HAU99289.1 macrolide ABC transporter ATP-binding protein [Candidatus Paceibacterota bacterium]HAX01820.1 macrolide ABC transporter ATP-binding protein [Candidatus Paceibacterota bacterium]
MLELRNVSKVYTVGMVEIHALHDVSLCIREGEFVAVMGPSGSGKSTLLHVASFLDGPTSGDILLAGERVTEFSEKKLAKLRNEQIGFIFQQFNLLDRVSALENVSLPLLYSGVSRLERIHRATEALVRVGLGERLQNTRSQLSGGQQQRVAIARALVNNPSIIFADEPTGNLDSKSSVEIMQILADLHKQGKTIVMVTHEEDIAKYAKRVIHMRDGDVI